MSSKLSRRDFLILASLLPLLKVRLPGISLETKHHAYTNRSPNVIILVFDTLSALHMSLHGYRRETTPNIARFADRSIVYRAHHSAANFTSPGTASILTGALPWTHRAFNNWGLVLDEFEDRNIFQVFGEGGYHRTAYTHNLLVLSFLSQFGDQLDTLTPLQDLMLIDHGLANKVFSMDFNAAMNAENAVLAPGDLNPSSLFISRLHEYLSRIRARNLNQRYGELFPRGVPQLQGHTVYFMLEEAISWIIDHVNSLPQPFFAYFHLMPPHYPYTARHEFVDAFQDGWEPKQKPNHFLSKQTPNDILIKFRREYDEYIAYVDAEFGRLYDSLDQNGILDNSYFVLTSDHGEMFERGIWRHWTPTLYGPITRVPLIISSPNQAERIDVYNPTSSIDLLPTLLKATGQRIPEWCEGIVIPPFNDGKAGSDRMIISTESKENPKAAPLTTGTISLVSDQYKMILYLDHLDDDDTKELYDLNNDSEERVNLYHQKHSVAKELENILLDKLAIADEPFTSS